MLPDGVMIKCGRCGYMASEWEFLPNGELGEQLVCPECGETGALFDKDDEE